jgi:hypothetical protein
LYFIIDHVLHVFNHAITFASPKFLLRLVRPILVRLLLCLFCPKGLSYCLKALVDRSGLSSEFQYGFRCDHSTTTALVRVIEDLRSWMTEERVTVLVLLDF